jgi:hypothetical protein
MLGESHIIRRFEIGNHLGINSFPEASQAWHMDCPSLLMGQINSIPMLMFLLIVTLAIYPANKSWGYVTGGSIGLLFLISWFLMMFNYE